MDMKMLYVYVRKVVWLELTKKEIDALFSDKFLDNNGNIDKNKIKSLDTNLLHSLAETFSDTYKVKTRYTAEQLLKKLFEDFKVEMRNPVSLSDVTTMPKVIKTGFLFNIFLTNCYKYYRLLL